MPLSSALPCSARCLDMDGKTCTLFRCSISSCFSSHSNSLSHLSIVRIVHNSPATHYLPRYCSLALFTLNPARSSLFPANSHRSSDNSYSYLWPDAQRRQPDACHQVQPTGRENQISRDSLRSVHPRRSIREPSACGRAGYLTIYVTPWKVSSNFVTLSTSKIRKETYSERISPSTTMVSASA